MSLSDTTEATHNAQCGILIIDLALVSIKYNEFRMVYIISYLISL